MTTEQPLIATDASGVIYGHKTFDSAPLGMTTIKAPVQEGQIFSLPELIQELDRLRAALLVAQAALVLERERICNALPGGYSVDPQWVADMVRGGA